MYLFIFDNIIIYFTFFDCQIYVLHIFWYENIKESAEGGKCGHVMEYKHEKEYMQERCIMEYVGRFAIEDIFTRT